MTSTLPNKQTLSSGGDDPTNFDPFEAWYPIFYVEDLDRKKPNSFTLLGQDIVIWWEEKAGIKNFTKAFYLPTKADLYISEFRNWFNNYNADPFPGESLPPLLSKEQLLDRYHSHTKNCSTCSTALTNIKTLRLLSGIIGAIAWIVSPIILFQFRENLTFAVSDIVVTFILAGSWFGLGKLEQRFYKGREIPLRNVPEK